MASDGKVVISTELDNSGFEKGIKTISGQLGGLGNTLKNIAAMLAAAFSTKKIIEFAAKSSQAAMQLSDALTGLKSILEGQGRNFSDAQDFIEEYVEDGLIPATNAINAYKNLASRGYDDGQIKQVMTALKDASAYGRQASYTMGEAVESATEGLKNENSILVDNAGVTKNVAKMWDEYAASIGTTANNLTHQQKIQAEVSGILKETKYQTGDAATVAGTLSGQLQQLSFRFNDLKVAVGNAINPIIQTLLPIINTAITSYGTDLYKASSTSFEIWFDVDANAAMMDVLGVSKIIVYRSADQQSWSQMRIYDMEDYPEMTTTYDFSHTGYVTYNYATPGYYYTAYITFYAKDSRGIGERYVYTEILRM